MTITSIAFDLDDTLLDTSRILIPVAGTPEFESLIGKPLPLMPGAKDNLESLKNKYRLFLVTQGDQKVQNQKIASLGIESYFREIYVAKAVPADAKRECFSKIFSTHHLLPQQMLAIGNRRSSEIRQAKKLGAWTCLMHHGEHINEPIEEPEDIPDFEIFNHQQLIKICQL